MEYQIYKKNVKVSGYKHQDFAILVELIQKFAIYKRSPSNLLSL